MILQAALADLSGCTRAQDFTLIQLSEAIKKFQGLTGSAVPYRYQ